MHIQINRKVELIRCMSVYIKKKERIDSEIKRQTQIHRYTDTQIHRYTDIQINTDKHRQTQTNTETKIK